MDEIKDRGLLDLSVELSTRDIMAGNDFTLYVLVNNPFAKPVWIRRVHVNLPSELRLANSIFDKKIKDNNEKKESSDKVNRDEQIRIKENIGLISQEINKLDSVIGKSKNTECLDDIRMLKNRLEDRMSNLIDKIDGYYHSMVNLSIDGASIGDLKVASKNANISISSSNEKKSSVGDIEILEPWLIKEKYAQVRKVDLESSLPKNTALQPGNTVVYSVVLNVNKSLLFRPSKYRLQFNANYSFNPEPKKAIEEVVEEIELFTNTIAYELSIRASIYSVITGSAIGGFVGGIARILKLNPSSISDILTWANLITISAAIILGIMSIIFMARKSDSQSFVSVEDFWGGLLVGFLVGYTGTSFFEDLTGISNPTLPIK